MVYVDVARCMKNKDCHGGSTSMLPEGKSEEVQQNIKNFWESLKITTEDK